MNLSLHFVLSETKEHAADWSGKPFLGNSQTSLAHSCNLYQRPMLRHGYVLVLLSMSR